jgi:hypothetical protein
MNQLTQVTLSILVSGLVGFVYGPNGELTLVVPAAGELGGHRAVLSGYQENDRGHVVHFEERLEGFELSLQPSSGYPSVERRPIAPGCPKVKSDGLPNSSNMLLETDWTVDFSCFGSSHGSVARTHLEGNSTSIVSSRWKLGGNRIQLKTVALEMDGAQAVSIKFAKLSDTKTPQLFQVAAETMQLDVTVDLPQGRRLEIHGRAIGDPNKTWSVSPVVRNGAAKVHFNNLTNVLGCTGSPFDPTCRFTTQRHFASYFSLGSSYDPDVPLPFVDSNAPIFSAHGAHESDLAPWLKIMAPGGRPICLMGAFKSE